MAELKNSLEKQDARTSRGFVTEFLRTQAAVGLHQTHSALKIGSSGPNLNDTRVGKIKRSKEICEGGFKVWFRLPSGLLWSIIKDTLCHECGTFYRTARVATSRQRYTNTKRCLPSTPEMTVCGFSALPSKGTFLEYVKNKMSAFSS